MSDEGEVVGDGSVAPESDVAGGRPPAKAEPADTPHQVGDFHGSRLAKRAKASHVNVAYGALAGINVSAYKSALGSIDNSGLRSVLAKFDFSAYNTALAGIDTTGIENALAGVSAAARINVSGIENALAGIDTTGIESTLAGVSAAARINVSGIENALAGIDTTGIENALAGINAYTSVLASMNIGSYTNALAGIAEFDSALAEIVANTAANWAVLSETVRGLDLLSNVPARRVDRSLHEMFAVPALLNIAAACVETLRQVEARTTDATSDLASNARSALQFLVAYFVYTLRRLDPKAENVERYSSIVAIIVLAVVVAGTWNADDPKSFRTTTRIMYDILDSAATQSLLTLAALGAEFHRRKRSKRRRKESKQRKDARKRYKKAQRRLNDLEP